MKFLNIPVSVARTPDVMQSTVAQIGIWLMLQCYCHEQMNGGCIVACRDWPDTMWQKVAGTDGATMTEECPLWHWTPVILVVHLYDTVAEEAYKKRQRMGKVYVERRWAALRERKIIQIESSKYEKPQKTITTQTPQNQQPDR